MASPISVSYLVIIIYLTVVIGGTLLVGLLPPLVNRPYCDDDAVLRVAVDPVFEDKIEAFYEPIVDVALDREKREVVEDRSWLLDELEERKRLADEHIQNRLQTSPIFARLKPLKAIENITTCSELTSPIAGVQYPWYDPRLPKEITPENYNIQILLDNLGGQLYDGFIDIKFNAKNDTNYLLLHIGKQDYPEIEFFKDKDGNDVEIACQGFFPYVRNDYYILKTVQPLNAAQSPYTVEILFVDYYTGVDNGVFKINYGETANNSTMFVSKFRPIDARRAFPLFDEPGIKATYDITIYHRPDFVAVSNTPVKSSGPDEIVPQIYTTVFETTPPMPTYYIALSAFNPNDFGFVTMNTTRSNIPVSLWARKQYIDGGFGQDPLEMSVKIFDALDDIFRGVGAKALPPKIDILVVPEYPVSGIGHFGLPIVEEDKILFKTGSATERDKQETALLIAQMFAEFWFGNFITQGWWDELWTQEGFVDYIKFRAVDTALGEWNILSQFIPTELVETLIQDGYPSSHPVQKPISSPYEIEEYFDLIETAKTAAILRMLENEFDYADMLQAIDNYLNANPWGTADIQVFYNNFTTFGNGWTVKDFFERWTKQANFPLLDVKIDDSQLPQQSVVFTQTRAMNSNSSIFSGDLLYPSQWNFTWYIPIQCAFGNGTDAGSYVREFEYYLDTRTATFTLPAGVRWTWVHCDRKFVGYFELVYTLENWVELGVALEQKNTEFVSEDRAQIIHNLFMNAYAERGDYYTIRSILEGYLSTETDYLPWRTVLIHAQRLSAVLAYRKTFYEFSEFFAYQVRQLEATIDIWSNEDGSHIDELLKETLIDLACDMQDSTCLQSASSRWPQALQILEHADFVNASIASYARQFVYDYHIENTYDVEDWDIIFREYAFIIDVNEQRKLINSLTYSRLPWLLIDVLKGIGENFVLRLDFFKIASVLKYNPLGREILWDEFRKEYENLIVQYGEDDPRLGWILVEITESFETEFLWKELLDFFTKATTGATANARFKSLEIVSTNIKWLDNNENEIRCAFRLMGPGADCVTNKVHPLLDLLNQPSSSYTRIREMFFNFLKNTNLPIFEDLKNRLL